MEPLFLAGHPALDFLNTAFTPPTTGEPVETIADGASFVAWLVEARLLDGSLATKLKRRFGTDALDEVASEARKFRLWAIAWLARWTDAPRGDYGAELQRLNRLLERASSYREVVTSEGGFQSVEHGRLDEAGDLVSIVASQLARLITEEDPALVKRCAGTGCVLWFVDRTKAHRRMFCSAAACGNRAKVAAFRERERGAG